MKVLLGNKISIGNYEIYKTQAETIFVNIQKNENSTWIIDGLQKASDNDIKEEDILKANIGNILYK